MDKKWIGKIQMDEKLITKKMLQTLREGTYKKLDEIDKDFIVENKEDDNFYRRSSILMEEAVAQSKKKVLTEDEEQDTHKNSVTINKNTPQFGDVRTSQEDSIKKTINDNVQFENDALRFYPDADDITLDGKIPSLNLSFQFRYSDPSSEGCYIFCDATQLTDSNTRMIGKVRDAYMNWKDSITQDGDLIEKLKKSTSKKNV